MKRFGYVHGTVVAMLVLAAAGSAEAGVVLTTTGGADGYVHQQMGVGYSVYASGTRINVQLNTSGINFTDQWIDRGILEFPMAPLAGVTVQQAYLKLTLAAAVTPTWASDPPDLIGKLAPEEGTIDVEDINHGSSMDLGLVPASIGVQQTPGTVYWINVTSFVQAYITANGASQRAGFILEPGGAFNHTGDEFFFAADEHATYDGPTLYVNDLPEPASASLLLAVAGLLRLRRR